jgi:hypothetical protein
MLFCDESQDDDDPILLSLPIKFDIAFMIHRRMNSMTSLSTKGSIIFSALLTQGIHLTNPPVDERIGHWNVV